MSGDNDLQANAQILVWSSNSDVINIICSFLYISSSVLLFYLRVFPFHSSSLWLDFKLRCCIWWRTIKLTFSIKYFVVVDWPAHRWKPMYTFVRWVSAEIQINSHFSTHGIHHKLAFTERLTIRDALHISNYTNTAQMVCLTFYVRGPS